MIFTTPVFVNLNDVVCVHSAYAKIAFTNLGDVFQAFGYYLASQSTTRRFRFSTAVLLISGIAFLTSPCIVLRL